MTPKPEWMSKALEVLRKMREQGLSPQDLNAEIIVLEALESAFTRGREQGLEEAAIMMDESYCLPLCDSMMHALLCPVVAQGAAIRAKKEGEKK